MGRSRGAVKWSSPTCAKSGALVTAKSLEDLQVSCSGMLACWHGITPLQQSATQDRGCAGATADAFTLFERLEVQLETHSGRKLAVWYICTVILTESGHSSCLCRAAYKGSCGAGQALADRQVPATA